MKNPFRTLTLGEEANIAITRLRRQLLQLQLERIDHDKNIASLTSKIEHLSKVTSDLEQRDPPTNPGLPLARKTRRDGNLPSSN